MTLTVADIDRWSSDAVRAVFHAATARGQATLEVSRQLSSLAVFDTWEGQTAAARKHHNALIRQDLDAHGNEALAVGAAAGKAADGIDKVQADLRRLRADAAEMGLWVDPLANKVVAGSGFRGDEKQLAAAQAELQPRLNAILAEANAVDADLAAAINMADGDTPIPAGPHENRPEIQDALSKPLPEDPQQFTALWNQLTPEEKDWLYAQDHNIGNHPGMPCDPPDHLGYDHYNRLNLDDQLARARAAAAQADALKAQHPDWAEGKNIPPPNEPGAIFDDRLAYEAWQRHYDAARNAAKNLPDLQAVDKALKAGPDRKLMLLDTQNGKQVHAAIAVGDPDTATHVSVTAPGLNTTVRDSIGGMADEAMHARVEARKQLILAGRGNETVSAIAWIGYDTPQVPGWDHLGTSLGGGWDVSHDTLARAGAHDLARFYDGIQASHQGGRADLTAIGHSYGSLTTGLALQQPGDHGVSRALFYGSPGIEASTPAQLHLQPGHVYAMEAPDDLIQRVYDGRAVAQGIPILGSYADAEFGNFGSNPATNPNFTRLATGPTTVPDGRALEGVSGPHAHSQYPQQGDNGQPRTSGYNIAAVIAGLKPISGN
ncbi:MAG: alpha/beta hydrolase [Mycobacterium sp.]|uniref:alpha/beta hydrolase n=1 Tax=Mycobacterium sp. TaxID=1785 RepID=UPI002622E291|nr:alpha/beta hydrolase [Mycobacterium sp.]MDI3314403.1 alpha/beta hydrolase [Mycobacterium sp.]